MGLFDTPPTRNTTYTTATPVDPNDLNDLQDKHIAARAEHCIPYHLSGWTSNQVGAVAVVGASGWWEDGGDPVSFITKGIDLPVGTILTRAVFHYHRPSVGPAVTFLLDGGDITDGSPGSLELTSDSTYDGTLQSIELDLDDTEIEADKVYRLRYAAAAANTGWGFLGALLYYRPVD
jgi:hypothetical protein